MDADRAGLEVLGRDECLALLATGRIGRVAFSAGALPQVLPVAYALDGSGIVIRVRSGSDLDWGTQDAVVAFEVDDLDGGQGSGWSVAVTGLTTDIVDPEEVDRARGLPIEGWGTQGADRFVRISLDLVSGRRGSIPAEAPGGHTRQEPPGGPAPAAVAETHSGVVFFLGDRAYKLKKPVDLGFLDFRTREARLEACRREVRLNRRLAPDVYLGVADVRDPDGRPADHLVVMRRMPADRRLASLVASGAPVRDHLAELARLLARFHASAARGPEIDAAATGDADARRWAANALEIEPYRGRALDPCALDEVSGLARRYVDGRQALFERRIADGKACDGHGDLLADDIFCLDDGPRILDCLEFDDRLRYGDVLADVAFLAMDLERLGRADLAAFLLDRYRSAAGDDWPPSLADHYVAYRAQVRAKVACVRWAQGDAGSREAAGQLLALGLHHLRRARVRLVLVGGSPGTGKSTLAQGLAEPLQALVLRSDTVRKELSGVDPGTHPAAGLDEGIYGPAATDATYGELLAQARAALTGGRTVVLDATWRHPAWREAAGRMAVDTASDLVELRCVAPVDVAVRRVTRRLAAGTDASDATEEVTRALAGRDGTWRTATEVDTSGDAQAAVTAALAAADLPPPGRRGQRPRGR